MKTKLIFIVLWLSLTIYNTQAQVTIGSKNSPAKGALLDLKENDNDGGGSTSTKGLILPRVNLVELSSLAPILTGSEPDIARQKKIHKGLQVYNLKTDLSLGLSEGIYSWNGDAWIQVTTPPHLSDDATRFLGGTIITKYEDTNSGSLVAAKQNRIIDPINGTHPIGSLNGGTEGNKIGGINDILGSGYTISHVRAGVFDIKFDVPFKAIYGVTSTILDTYQDVGWFYPVKVVTEEPGTYLSLSDNMQVSYLDNNIVRLETGNNAGGSYARSFTFLVIGK